MENAESIAYFDSAAISSFDKRYRASFINSLSGFKSVVLVGTQDAAGRDNLAVFSSFFHLGSAPPLFGLVFRAHPASMHTLENISDNGVYTVNHINDGMYRMAHQTGAPYDGQTSEFKATGLDPEYHGRLKAPYVRQSQLKFGMKMVEKIPLVINGTTLIIGTVEEAFIPQDVLGTDGYVDIEKAGTVALSGLDSYHSTHRLSRLNNPQVTTIIPPKNPIL